MDNIITKDIIYTLHLMILMTIDSKYIFAIICTVSVMVLVVVLFYGGSQVIIQLSETPGSIPLGWRWALQKGLCV